MHIFNRVGKIMGGALLIAATTIGIGMLGLPIATGPSGLLPSVTIYFLTWLFMLSTGLLLLEVCIWMPKEANLITMTERLLGPWGKALCWVVYLFLFVAAMIAHVSVGGSTLVTLFGTEISHLVSVGAYVLLFSPVVYLGTKFVDRFNSLLMVGVLVSFCLFLFLSLPHVNIDLLKFVDWTQALPGLPVLFAAFTYQLIIPTLMTYMDRDVAKVRLSIFLGTCIPLVIYLVWEVIILGIVPVDSLIYALSHGQTAVMPLEKFLGNPLIFKIGSWFAFFVMTTSYIALALAFLDFLADGLKVKKEGFAKVALCVFIFGFPTLIALIYPGLFLTALKYIGGICCALLFGLLPPVMVWIGRYKENGFAKNPQLFGGKWMLVLLIAFISFELALEIMSFF